MVLLRLCQLPKDGAWYGDAAVASGGGCRNAVWNDGRLCAHGCRLSASSSAGRPAESPAYVTPQQGSRHVWLYPSGRRELEDCINARRKSCARQHESASSNGWYAVLDVYAGTNVLKQSRHDVWARAGV